MRVEHEGDAAAWVTGTLMTPNCAGTQTASATGVMALSEFVFVCLFFEPLVASNQKASLASLSP